MGVRLIKVADGNAVASMAVVPAEAEDEAEGESEPETEA